MLAAAEEKAEARDLSEAMALVSEGYADENGFDKARLRDFVRAYLLTHPRISLLLRTESIEFPAEDLARARVTVGVLGTGAELAADVQSFDLELVREGEDWRLLRADRSRTSR